MRVIILGIFLFPFLSIVSVSSEDCLLENNCRLVDINGDEDWANEPGHYKVIQNCIDEATEGDTCIIRPGSYHEEIIIANKNNLAVRGDVDYDLPILDGTIVLNPKNNNENQDFSNTEWKEDTINGKKVCIGEIDVENDKHPFQLFLKEDGDYEMMTNARWPNALWTDRHPDTGVPNVFYNDYWRHANPSECTNGKMVDQTDGNGESALAASGLDMTGAMAILNIESFLSYHRVITDHKSGNDFFMYDTHNVANNHDPKKDQYYIDSKENLMDIPGEWFYNKDTKVLKFMPPSGKCPDGKSDAVKGRVMDYAIKIEAVDGLSVSNINFFASNVMAETKNHDKNDVSDLILDSLNFAYPVSSHRMLQDDSIPKTTNVLGEKGGPIVVDNCVFYGGEGSALVYTGVGVEIRNNLFMWNDWSGVMQGGGAGTVWTEGGDQNSEVVEGNTFWYNGASATLRTAPAAHISQNIIAGTRCGNIMNDGAGCQIMAGRADLVHFERNWMHDIPVSAVRIDGGSTHFGFNTTIANNVAWKTGSYMIKGDYHNVTGNLALGNTSLKVVHIRKSGFDAPMNNHTIVEDNLAMKADGDKDLSCEPHHRDGAYYQLAGIKSNNYYGNYSIPCGGEYDGSVVLDGVTVPGEKYTDLPDYLVDIYSYDFRPKPDTIITSTGRQIGPYPSKYSNGDTYIIPGRKESAPTFPIPAHNTVVEMRNDLIFKQAYRCNKKGDKHMIYIAKAHHGFPPLDEPTTEIDGDGNVVVFKDIDFTIEADQEYKWRVDCVESGSNNRKQSDEWSFTMKPEK